MPCPRRRGVKTALTWTLAIDSGETFCSLSEMLGTSLFWPFDDAGVVPAGVDVGDREILLDLARAHPATSSDGEDETRRQPSAHAANCT